MCIKCRGKKEYRIAAKQLKEAKRAGALLGLDVTQALLNRGKKISTMEQEVYNNFQAAKVTLQLIHQARFPEETHPKNKKAVLTKREAEVLDLYLTKISHKEIANKLGISAQSIQRYITIIKIKLNLH